MTNLRAVKADFLINQTPSMSKEQSATAERIKSAGAKILGVFIKEMKMKKDAKRKIALYCVGCNKNFHRVLGPNSTQRVICPKCNGRDIVIK